jgi:hypothetical protein
MQPVLCSVPTTPDGCLLVTPVLARFITPEDYAGAWFIMLDVGKQVASIPANGKVRFAYRFYMKTIDKVIENEGMPAKVGLIIPDDWDLKTHLRLAENWLRSQERKLLINRLVNLGASEIAEVLVIRRIIHAFNQVDASPFKPFIGLGLTYGIPLNVSTALADGSNIRCSTHPCTCIQHAKLVTTAVVELDPGAVFHLMGPPIATVLTKLMNEPRVASADTTSHRVDVKHVRYVNRQVNPRQLTLMNLISLRRYLS